MHRFVPFIALLTALQAAVKAQEPQPVIIDTDAGSDDLMAITFLLNRKDVKIEAITVVNGLAHADRGARNIAGILQLVGRSSIPVFIGCNAPLEGNAEFPAPWRKTSDTLPALTLPVPRKAPQRRHAVDYLAARLAEAGRPVKILALGPHTNLAKAFERVPNAKKTVQEIVMMGGAVHVPGNLADGGYFKTSNKTAEWNIFIDPVAAARVFASGVKIRMIPLDATNHVPIGVKYLDEIERTATGPSGRIVRKILESDRNAITEGFYYAWDPLAAVALVEPSAVAIKPLAIEIRLKPPEEGRTAEVSGKPANAQVAIAADAGVFQKTFLSALR